MKAYSLTVYSGPMDGNVEDTPDDPVLSLTFESVDAVVLQALGQLMSVIGFRGEKDNEKVQNHTTVPYDRDASLYDTGTSVAGRDPDDDGVFELHDPGDPRSCDDFGPDNKTGPKR